MSASSALLKDLQRQQKALEVDLLAQSEQVPELAAWLEEQYAAARRAERTGATYGAWLKEQIMQAAAAWLLGTVFVRFCEDNGLIDSPWLSGPGDRAAAAGEAQTAYFLRHPTHNDRQWILASFDHLASFPAASALFDDHNPVRRLPISGDAARALLDFWRKNGTDGQLVHDFTDSTWDTRFLGDLYQDMSQLARKQYALLQTPEFVEEFLLDLTLTPSLKEYGLEDTSLIDPTCGSGHFLLGAFGRLATLWANERPGMDVRERVQKALDQVTGVDINPFAVAIARFRLTLAALQACGVSRLAAAPAFRMRLAAGDSLLFWDTGDQAHQGDLLADEEEQFAFYTEDGDALRDLLQRGQYTVTVGNPPYITVKDHVLNRRYRNNYPVCHRQYALSVPFVERFFQLAKRQDSAGRAGFVGQITSNSFMKREFGKKLIEEYFPTIQFSHVVDTSGAYLPGHGTPTVILIGQRRAAVNRSVRAVLGILGEPGTPEDPAEGLVWSAIVENITQPGIQNPYVTVTDVPPGTFTRHPWSLSGGGASDLRQRLELTSSHRLSDKAEAIGYMVITGEDDAFGLSAGACRRMGVERYRSLSIGEDVRDYQARSSSVLLWPYGDALDTLDLSGLPAMAAALWPVRRHLQTRKRFGIPVERIEGFKWHELREVYRARLRTPLSLARAEVATHNHFALDRGDRVFTQASPVIKLATSSTEDDYLALVGLLNSSVACFWLKQVSHDKGSQGVNEGFKSQEWERFYQFNSTKLEEFPVPQWLPLERSRGIDELAAELSAMRPEAVCLDEVPTGDRLAAACLAYERIRRGMVALQEELDWEVYRVYGLLEEDLNVSTSTLPEVKLGERAFEIVLARKIAAGESDTQWFERHGSIPITDIPEDWPVGYREVVQRRIEIIERRPDIGLIERPDCKRRWSSEPWARQQQDALRNWLLDWLEADQLWSEDSRARVLSVSLLADLVRMDREFRGVLDLYVGRDDYDLAVELTKLVADEAVPFLAAYCYKAASLWKRRDWERTWDLQRKEDAGESVGEIVVPPKFKSADFAKTSYWRNRGKLDVPKERFVLYPKAGRDTDKSPVIGWAGWDHVEKAQALATLYLDRQGLDGWPADRLLPLLAGLAELEPWLHQWYEESDPTYGGSPADFYTAFLDQQLAKLGRSRADLGGISA